jgi:hypothetical protein
MTKYLVLQTINSRQHQRLFEPGEIIEFAPNHVAPEGETLPPGTIIVDVDLLIEMGAITPIPPEPGIQPKPDKKKEVE